MITFVAQARRIVCRTEWRGRGKSLKVDACRSVFLEFRVNCMKMNAYHVIHGNWVKRMKVKVSVPNPR